MQAKKTLLFALVIVLIAGAAFYFGRMTNKIAPQVMAPGDQQSSDSTSAPVTSTDTSVQEGPVENISIAWTNPTLVSDAHFTVDPKTITSIDLKTVKTYKVGTVTGGAYNSDRLLLAYMPSDGPCFGFCNYPVYLLDMNSSYKMLSYYGGYGGLDDWLGTESALSGAGFDPKVVSRSPSIRIVGFGLPVELTDTLHKMTLTYPGTPEYGAQYAARDTGPVLFDATGLIPVYIDPIVGQVYTTKVYATLLRENPAKTPTVDLPNGFYFKRSDGTLATYRLKIPFMSDDRTIADITWNDGIKNTGEFTYQTQGGCGGRDYLSLIDTRESDLVPAGTAANGDTVYAFKDKNNKYLVDRYADAYKGLNNELTYEKFLSLHPMVLWKDPLGRWVAFYNRSIGPAAECGKPVIYLYPEKAENVSVKLAPQGGFSKTEPTYGKGWNVFATPEGVLTNLADNLTYPYLFWEGSGGAYMTPEQGWVVKQADVHSFLVSKLAALGLNAKETADFLEFWEPRMQGSPYYFVTFLGNTAMNRIAPLTVSPAPDTVIRILMDYTPLAKPIKVESPTIRTPERKGFTVVEWGGVLR